jgi:hypothetical protein
MLAGVEAGHWIAYRLVYPDAFERQQVLADSGHGYMGSMPLVLAVIGAVGACALVARAVARRGVTAGRLCSPVPFLLLAPVAFTLQELIERAVAGQWPFSAMFVPTFLPGLIAQLPFALAAYLIARWLLRAADRVRGLLRAKTQRRVPRLVVPRPPFPGLVGVARRSPFAAGWVVRGPPDRLVALTTF